MPLRSLLWLLAGMFLLPQSGCAKSAPVQEVSAATGGAAVRADDLSALSSEWSSWRGPSGNGHVPDQPLLTTWSETQNVLWQVDVPGRGHGSPIVIGDWILLSTAEETAQEQSVVAYRRQDGLQVWSRVLHQGGFPGTGEMHHKSTHANPTLASDGARVYCAFLNSGKIIVSALDVYSGKTVWEQDVGDFISVFGYAPSPLLYQSLVIVAGDNKGGGYLVALDRETGAIAWRVARPAENTFSSPAVVALQGRDQLVITGSEQVTSYNPATGDLLWNSPGTAKATCGTVVATADRVFASGGFPGRQTVCLDGSGRLQWSTNDRLYEPSLLVFGEFLYGVSDDGFATCWSVADGQEQWKQRLGGSFSASPIVCNGLIYVSNLSGQTYVFRANPKFYEEVAVNKLGDDCYTSGAVKESRLYLRIGRRSGTGRKEQLVCLGE